MGTILCDKSMMSNDIGLMHVGSATVINTMNGRVYDRPIPRKQRDPLSPAMLAAYVNENPPGDFYDEVDHAQLFSPAPPGVQANYLIWYHVDYTLLLEEERVPVQSKLDRLTSFLRRRVANYKWRLHVFTTAFDTMVDARSPIKQLPPDLLKHILELAA